MAAQRRGGFALRGRVLECGALDGERLAIDPLAHELVVEGAGAARRIDAAQVVGENGVTRHGDAAAAFLPQQELQQALDIAPREVGGLAVIGQNGGAKDGDGAVAAFQG